METLKRIKANYIIEAVLMIIVGIVFIVWSRASLEVMVRALAVLLFMGGILMITSYFVRKEYNLVMHGGLAMGIIITAVSIWIFARPDAFTELIPKLFGIFIVVGGVMNIVQTFSLLKYGYSYWWISLIFALSTIILGGILLLYPDFANEVAVTLIGAFLIYDGITNLWTISRVTKYAQGIRQAISDANAIDTQGVYVKDSAER
ncbi:MAG: DUF308 domain-containing protein [Butyrivibrio sp.]|nr:DUF308 domain-containing protein [Butyrivibrio sp.]